MTFMSPKLTGKSSDVFELEINDSSGYAVDWHAHDCHMLLLPLQGGLFLSTENTPTSHISRHSFSFVPAEFAHATQAAPGREKHMTLYVDPSYIRRQGQMHGYCSFAKQIGRAGIWEGTEALDSILRLHDQLRGTASPETFQRQLPHLNHLMFEECARVIASQQTRPHKSEQEQHAVLVRDIQRYVRENLEADLSIESIGHQFHLSRRHLTRVFKAATGETLLDFTNRARVEAAARLVSSTRLSILDVSLAVGLHSPSYLTRLFHRHLGMSPRELRRSR